MAGEYAQVTPGGGVLIDTAAWIAARTGGVRDDLTDQLHTWALDNPDGPPTAATGPLGVWPDLARSWCEHTGHHLTEPGLVAHTRTRLDTNVWILPATSTGDGDGDGLEVDTGRIVVIGVGDRPPVVHTDTTTDPWAWCDADTVSIDCPGKHWWTWRSGRELLTSTRRPATLTGVFGVNLDAPFSPCRDCAAYQLGNRSSPCGCDGAPWIVCPVCGRRCRLGPPNP